MASLDELVNSGLGGIISQGGAPLEESLYQRQALSDREALSGRGLGLSTVTRDALAKARVDASMAAQQAQLSALGQAASVTQGNANRAQQESQFSRNLKQQKDMQNTQMIAGGVGAGVGALGQLGGAALGPEIRSGTRGLFGKGPLEYDKKAMGVGNGTPAGTYTGGPSPIPGFGDPTGVAGGNDLAALTDFANLGGGSGGGGFDFSSYTDPGLFGGLDLSALYDQSFDPYQYGYM